MKSGIDLSVSLLLAAVVLAVAISFSIFIVFLPLKFSSGKLSLVPLTDDSAVILKKTDELLISFANPDNSVLVCVGLSPVSFAGPDDEKGPNLPMVGL